MSDETRTVAIVGTFDVRNYGDLLFPLVAAHRLEAWGMTLTAFSPAGGTTGWADAVPCGSMLELAAEADSYDGFLVGGGNIVHTESANLPDYPRQIERWAYPSLWLGATALAAIANRPIVWNAPGVSRHFERDMLEHLIQPALSASEYVSVRDSSSRKMIDPAETRDVHVVPDTVLDLPNLWPKESLEQTFTKLLERKGQCSSSHRYFSIHAKLRSLLRSGPCSVARMIEAHSAKSGEIPILIAIGQCHDDQVAVRKIAHEMRSRFVLLDDPLGLKEIASAICYSVRYVGCSLHGYITAAAYGCRGRIVAQPELPKQMGFLSQIGRESDLALNWELAFESILIDEPPISIPVDVTARLDRHWERVAESILCPRSGLHTARGRYLRQMVKWGMSKGGWEWFQPAMTSLRLEVQR